MRPKVHTEKHVIQQSLFTIASGAIANQIICAGKAVPTLVTDVREGATVSAVYIEMWITSDDTTLGTTVITVERLAGNATFMLVGQAAALNSYTNKKNILHTQQGLTGSNLQYPSAVIKGWIKIPKGKQRFSLNDSLILNIFAQSNGLTGCGFFLYKEQY